MKKTTCSISWSADVHAAEVASARCSPPPYNAVPPASPAPIAWRRVSAPAFIAPRSIRAPSIAALSSGGSPPHSYLGRERHLGELELCSTPRANRVVELDDPATARTLLAQLPALKAVAQRRDQPQERDEPRDQEPHPER